MTLRVLAVDDWQDTTISLAILLEAWGHRACTAFAGESALALAEAFRPDVVILDLGMPKMDGYEVARRLRQTFGEGLRIICLSGYGRAEDRQRSREAGCDHHLLKPADLDELQRLLQFCEREAGRPALTTKVHGPHGPDTVPRSEGDHQPRSEHFNGAIDRPSATDSP
jgi:DNA-binding response OmpR family regulator